MSHIDNKTIDSIFHNAAGTYQNATRSFRRAKKNLESGASVKGLKEVGSALKERVKRVNPFK